MSNDVEPTAADRLQERLNDPQVADGLNRLLNQLETVTFAVESVDGLLRRGEVITETLADGVNELRTANAGPSQELLQKTPQLLQTGAKLAEAAGDLDVDELAKSELLKRLSEPKTLATLNELLEKLPMIAFLIESLEGFISRGDTVVESVAEMVGDLNLKEQGFELDKLAPLAKQMPKMAEAADKLLASDLIGDGLPKVIDAGVSMIESGMLDQEVVQTLGDLGRKSAQTYTEVASQPVAPIGGLFATLKATKDPDVQKSVGFFFAFAKAFAKHLD